MQGYNFCLRRKVTIAISEYTHTHNPAIVELLNDEYKNSREYIPFDEERVLSQIRKRRLKILVAEESGKTLGLVASHFHENSEAHITWLTVSKRVDWKTVENKLIDELEKQASIKAVSIMVDEDNPRIPDWINRGYKLEPGYLSMSARLNEPRLIPKVDEGTKLRSMKTDEIEQLVTTVNEGFGWRRLELEDFETWKTEDPPFNEDWVQVAEAERKIVSVVVARPDTDSIRFLHVKRGYMGPAATLSHYRNKHLASALTARAMNFLFEKGMDSVRLGTSETNASSKALLRNLGFNVEHVRKTLHKSKNI